MPRRFAQAIVLPADPASALEAAPKQYVDARAVPTGGSAAQVLAKASGTDNDVAWVDAATGGGGGTGLRYNLVSNPSAETNATGWTGTSPLATVARSTSNPGPSSANISSTASTTGTGTIRPPQCSGIEVGKAYTFSVFVRSSVARTVTPQIIFQTAASATVSTISGTAVSLAAGTWTRVSVTGVAPDTTAMLQPVVSVASLASTNVIQVDEALVEQAPIMNTYFDGADGGASWSGTANNSTSSIAVNPAGQVVALGLRTSNSTATSATTASAAQKVMQVDATVTPGRSYVIDCETELFTDNLASAVAQLTYTVDGFTPAVTSTALDRAIVGTKAGGVPETVVLGGRIDIPSGLTALKVLLSIFIPAGGGTVATTAASGFPTQLRITDGGATVAAAQTLF